jgi:hypothetical protein
MNKPALLLGLVAVGCGAGLYHQYQQASALRSLVASHQKSAQEITGKLERAKAEIEELNKKLAVLKSEAEARAKQLAEAQQQAAAAPVETTPGAEKPAEAGRKFMQGLAKMFTDPEMKKSMRQQQLMGVRMMYGDLAKQLGLSAQEAEQVMELLADRQMELAAVGMGALDPNNPNKDDLAKKTADAGKRYEEQLTAVLGAEKYQQLKDYESSIGDRFMLQQFEGQFASAGTPLDAQQREQLLSLMREERKASPNDAFNNADPAQQMALLRDGNLDQFVASQEAMQRRVLAKSREFLTPDQVATYEKVQQQQLDFIKMQMKMAGQMFGGGK